MTDFPKVAAALGFLLSTAPCFAADWSPRLAADYLDGRQKEWFAWAPAKQKGGVCISCHTGMTYLFARPALRRALGESNPTSYETGLRDSLRARLDQNEPKDPSAHAAQQLGVESVFASLFVGHDDADRAFDRMWALQSKEGKAKGGWAWFSLDRDPWEMPESEFYGATLAALATGGLTTEHRENVLALSAYLQREQAAQPLHNKLMLLWAATKLPEALPQSARRSILEKAWSSQQTDGGWTMHALGPWTAHADAPSSTGTNSYATAFTAFALEQGGIPRDDPRLTRALDWLRAHQDRKSGAWPAGSMNKVYEPDSMQIKFMQDAATSFASLALIEAEPSHSQSR